MSKKIIIGGIAAILILAGVGGYSSMWWIQSKKLQHAVVKTIDEINNVSKRMDATTYKITYDSIEIGSFPYKIKSQINNLVIKTEKSVETKASRLNIPIVYIDSDLMLKSFEIKHDKNMAFTDDNNITTNIDFDPHLKVTFFQSPFKAQNLINDRFNFEIVKEVSYSNHGYKVLNLSGKILHQSDAKNYFDLVNHSNKENHALTIKANIDNNKDQIDIIGKNVRQISIEKLQNAFLSFDINAKKKRVAEKEFEIDIKDFKFNVAKSSIEFKGQLQLNMVDFIPFGSVNFLMTNYQDLFNILNEAIAQPKPNDIDFMNKFLPEAANEKYNNDKDLMITYQREKDKPTMIGNKTLEEFLSQHYIYKNNKDININQ